MFLLSLSKPHNFLHGYSKEPFVKHRPNPSHHDWIYIAKSERASSSTPHQWCDFLFIAPSSSFCAEQNMD